MVARAIHDQSARRHSKLVSVNCAAIPRELIESEMFGHERGAFTGATNRRHGRFELAHGGTLFLDEIGDLDGEAQAKLLRVLETGSIQRVGGENEITVDVRIVAATNQDLRDLITRGIFREDLFYRLNVFPIHVPPLRVHSTDIPLLVVHLAAQVSERTGRPAATFTADAMRRLARHTWPGNVRELANIVERLVIITAGREVGAADVHAALGASPPRVPSASQQPGGLADALQSVEKTLIADALQQADGNVAEAARHLNTDRANLYRRMRRLAIDPKDTPVSK